MSTKANCWQMQDCGRQPGGARVSELGVCPASQVDMSGFNGGSHAGRICWSVAGTFCRGQVQGTFAQKAINCMACGVYQTVQREEGAAFRLLPAR